MAAVLAMVSGSLVSVAACGAEVPEGLVVTGSSPAAPYRGPLRAKAPDIDGDEDDIQVGVPPSSPSNARASRTGAAAGTTAGARRTARTLRTRP